MSTTSTVRPRATGRALPWLCVAGMVLCVAALPLVAGDDPVWPVWLLGGGAVVLPVVAAGLLTRVARREDEAFGALAAERDALAAGLTETTRALEETTASLVAEQEERVEERSAVETAVVALSRKVQASAHRVQEEAARMVQRHPADPDVLESSMRIDHAAAQHARQAQSLVALCGRRPGQTWDDPLPLPDVVRAAAGRITAYGRVEVAGDPGQAVLGRAVEPLVHVVAELLANATQCSPPNTQVIVTLRQVQRGAVVEIDDCGVGMDPRELDRVRPIASGTTAVGIAGLGQVPQTGLAVVGTYARFLGLRVDLVESVYGGLRAVVLIPAELTQVASAPVALTASAHEAWDDPLAGGPVTGSVSTAEIRAVTAGTDAADADGAVPDGGAAAQVPEERPGPPVLPQRRSRRAALDRPVQDAPEATGAETEATGSPASPVGPASRTAVTAPDRTAEEAGAWIGAFFAATAGPREDRDDRDQDHDQQDDPQDDLSVTVDAPSEDR